MASPLVQMAAGGIPPPCRTLPRWRNARAKARINATLAEAASEMGCDGEPEEGASSFEYWMRASVTYAENDIYSVEIHSGWFCGGAHGTNDDNSSMTFDLRTGSVVGFADLFANYARDKDAVLAAVFGEEVETYRIGARKRFSISPPAPLISVLTIVGPVGHQPTRIDRIRRNRRPVAAPRTPWSFYGVRNWFLPELVTPTLNCMTFLAPGTPT